MQAPKVTKGRSKKGKKEKEKKRSHHKPEPNSYRGPWTDSEDERLVQLVNLHGARKW